MFACSLFWFQENQNEAVFEWDDEGIEIPETKKPTRGSVFSHSPDITEQRKRQQPEQKRQQPERKRQQPVRRLQQREQKLQQREQKRQ